MADPLTRDFSFAVMLVLAFGDNFQFYIWEIHDGVFRIGELDAITGEYINISDESMYIEHDRSTGIISFLIPESHLPDRIDQIGARSFHTPFRETRPQPTTCDFAGLYNLPESLR